MGWSASVTGTSADVSERLGMVHEMVYFCPDGATQSRRLVGGIGRRIAVRSTRQPTEGMPSRLEFRMQKASIPARETRSGGPRPPISVD